MSKMLIMPIERDIVAPTGRIVGVVRDFRIPGSRDLVGLRGLWTVVKYADEGTYAAMLAGDPEALPYEAVLTENTFFNSGINEAWNILAGTAGHAAFNNANAQIGIGDSSTAFAATQTDLQATTNKFYQAVDSGYPSISGQTITFQATIGAANALYPWNEMVVKNGSSSICLDRVVANQGTKSGSNVWTAQVQITMS